MGEWDNKDSFSHILIYQYLSFLHRPAFYLAPRAERLKYLNFNCKCEACVNNYPIRGDPAMKMSPVPIPRNLADFYSKYGNNHGALTRKASKRILGQLCRHIQKIDKYIPCSDYVMFSTLLTNCLSFLYDPEDYKTLLMSMGAEFSCVFK